MGFTMSIDIIFIINNNMAYSFAFTVIALICIVIFIVDYSPNIIEDLYTANV